MAEFPLSANQESLWFAAERDGPSTAATTSVALDHTGPLDADTVRRAWLALVLRHDALRTRFGDHRGVPFQTVLDDPILDVEHGEAEERPFDLRTGPLARVRVCETQRRLVVSAHHIVADPASVAILAAELRDVLHDIDLPPVPARYQDFVTATHDQPAPLELPHAPSGAEVVGRTLPADLTAAVVRLAGDHDVSVRVLLITAFQLVLHHYTGQQRIVVGIDDPGRDDPRFERVVGCFAHPVPVDLDLGGDPTFAELLTRGATALTHESRHVARHVHRAADDGTLPSSATSHELTLVSTDSGSLSLEYLRHAHSPATAAAMLEHFEELLTVVTADPGVPLGKLAVTTHRELRTIAAWNDTAREHSALPWVHDAFFARAAERPDDVALRMDGQSVTYGDLARRVRVLAAVLHARGAGPGTIVGIAAERSPELVVALLATLTAGAAYLPLDPDYPTDRVAFMITDARPPVVLTQSHLRARLPSVPVIVLDEPVDAPAADVTPVDGGTLAYVIYTSGSTGRPKGVMITHEALRNRIAWTQDTFGLTRDDRVLQKTPSSFDVSVWEFFWPLTVGATLVLARPGGQRDLGHIVDVIRAEGVTTVHFVPSVLRLFLTEPDVPACGSLRRVLCSGEALPVDLAQEFHRRLSCELHNLYGPTEATVDVTWWPCVPDEDSVPIGRPVHNTAIHILDRAGRPVPIGAAGEICIGGVQVAAGYLNRPELTAQRFVPDEFSADPAARLYRTGDLGRFRRDGAVEYLGRLDHQVKIHGNRVEIGEIETRLAAHPAVRDAVVTVNRRSGAPALEAHVVPDGAPPDPAELLAHLRRHLPVFMLPNRFRFLDELPLTPSGKADRTALMAEAADTAGQVDARAPRTPAERTVVRAASAVLGTDVGVEDDVLPTTAAVLRLRAELAVRGLSLSVRDILRARTPAALAATATELDAAGLVAVSGRAGPARVELRVKGRYDEPAMRAAFDALTTRHTAGPLQVRLDGDTFHVRLDLPPLDRWSTGLVAAELLENYVARTRGEPLPHTEPPAVTVVEDTAATTSGSPLHRRIRAAGRHRTTVPVPGDHHAALVALARGMGVPLEAVLLAAHVRVVAMLTGDTTVTTTTVVSGRPDHVAGDRLVGAFDRSLALRVEVTGSWRELVRRVSASPRDRLADTDTGFAVVDVGADEAVAAVAGVELLGRELHDAPATRTLLASFHPSEPAWLLDVDDTVGVPFLGDYYAAAVAALAADPDGPVDADLRPDEEKRLVARVNATERVWPSDTHQPDPAAVAVRAGDDELTYAALDSRAGAIAHRLREVGAAGIVAVAVTASTDLPATLLAVHRIGAAYTPVTRTFLDSATRTARDLPSGVTAVVTDNPDAVGNVAATVVDLRTVTGPAAPPAAPGTQALVVRQDGETVAITHAALENALRGLRDRLGWQDDQEVLLTAGTDFGWAELFLPLSTGGRLVLADDATLLDLLETGEATTMIAGPHTWRRLTDAGWAGDPALRIVCAGTTTAWPDLSGLGRAVWGVYGHPKTAFWSTATRLDSPGAMAPLPNTTCHVLRPDGSPAPIGVPGELAIGGTNRTDLGRDSGPTPVGVPAIGGPDSLYRTGIVVVRQPDGELMDLAESGPGE